MKQNITHSTIFPQKAHRALYSGKTLVGLGKDSATLFINEHFSLSNSSFFLEFENNEEAFAFYGSCIEGNEQNYVYFPPKKVGGVVPGFGLENVRFRKEAVLRLSSEVACCCIGSVASLKEPSISKNIEEKILTRDFICGDKIDVAESIDCLVSLGYERDKMALEPGKYSIRGDVLDVFPHHFRNPYRISFDYDRVENITLYDPDTQLSIKSIDQLRIKDYNENTQTIDNISLVAQYSTCERVGVRRSGKNFSFSKKSGGENFVLKTKNVFLTNREPEKRAKELLSALPDIARIFLITKNKEKTIAVFPDIEFHGIVGGSINKSFVLEGPGVLVVSENDVFSTTNPNRKWAPNEGTSAAALERGSISNTKVGELIVHQVFGIGIYRGIKKTNNKESVEIEYENNARVYVSLDQVALVHRYVGAGKKPKISRLGSKKWANEVRRAKEATHDVALDVLRAYSTKNKKRPFCYEKENDLGDMLSQSFSFIETPDQKKTINDVFSDMNSEIPMDRLICGDVGFGKTEVAIRSMFKAFLSDRLSVFLCPTTILADQHYITCEERLGVLGVKVALLSRFKSKAEQSRIIKELKNKGVDVLVGTHRILSKDVVLSNLGLLVIDEEHRFGVKHKEQIRNIRAGVDVLTLTATPIPRTLQQSLVGLRDISIMSSPPKTRRPILTSVRNFDWSVVYSRIEFELSRSGQVYFLNNDISTIPLMVKRIESRFPNSTTVGASGKMPSKELEEIVLSFFRGEIDVLVCTTIIESGLDVTNANTIIIKDAQNLGLSQLYQIRGRVGRGHRQAYCLLAVPSAPLEEGAFKRLRTLEKNTSLGSGYSVSIQDLEIRGAGSVFGHRQSGHVSSVGFQMYCDLLSAEVQNKSSPNGKPFFEPQIQNEAPLDIGEDYIKNMSTRIDYYYRIGRATNLEDLVEVENNLIDVFGPIPPPTQNLLLSSRLRILYTNTPVSTIDIFKSSIEIVIDGIKEKEHLGFLTAVGKFEDPNLSRLQFKEVGDGGLKVVLFSSSDVGVGDLAVSFVGLFDHPN